MAGSILLTAEFVHFALFQQLSDFGFSRGYICYGDRNQFGSNMVFFDQNVYSVFLFDAQQLLESMFFHPPSASTHNSEILLYFIWLYVELLYVQFQCMYRYRF